MRFFYIVRVRFLIAFLLLVSLSFAADLSAADSSAYFRVDSIVYDIGDAFDDSKAHTKYDRLAYDLLNWVHIETKEMTVRKLLLFNQGDLANLDLMLESERFLREQRFLSDASIMVSQDSGMNIVKVHTSDNWTLTIPVSFGFSGSEWSYDNLNWGIGVQESNFLGLGQLLGFYFGHNEFRDMWQVEYGDPHFIFRYNHLDFLYSYNTDGYLASWQMYVPFLSRSVNQWAYTLAGLKNESYYYVYGSGDMPPGTVESPTDKPLDSLQRYNGKKSVQLMQVKEFVSDSLSFRVSRSFGELSASSTSGRLTTTAGLPRARARFRATSLPTARSPMRWIRPPQSMSGSRNARIRAWAPISCIRTSATKRFATSTMRSGPRTWTAAGRRRFSCPRTTSRSGRPTTISVSISG